MTADTIASLRPITQIDGTIIRLQQTAEHLLVCVRMGSRETSRQVDANAAQRFWMGMKGALPVTQAVEAMKIELLNAQGKARLAGVTLLEPTKIIPV